MTRLGERRETAASTPGETGRRTRRTGVVVAAVVVAALAVVAGVSIGVVRTLDVAALDEVHVFLDDRSFDCERPDDVTAVSLEAAPGSAVEGDGYRVPALALRPSLDCRMSVVVRNDSDRTIEIDRIVFPLFGAANGWGVQADHLYTQGLEQFGPPAADAVFDLVQDPENDAPYSVREGEAQRIDVHVAWRPTCVDAGGSGSFTDAPVLTLSSGLVTLERAGEGPGYAVVGTEESAALC